MSRFLLLLIVAGGLVIGPGREVQSATPQVPVVMTGAWFGTAEVIAEWIEQPSVGVSLVINSEGRVRGTIGDATLRNGRFERSRGGLTRFFNIKSDWVVTAELKGSLIRAEGLQGLQITMPLTWVGDHFEGTFTVWDPTVRGAANRIASGRFRLDRL